MSATADDLPIPDFEIDHPEVFGQFLLSNPREVNFYLNLLAKRRCILTAYIDGGHQFFLTSIVGIDEANDSFFLDPSNGSESNTDAQAARQITLVTNLDRVKIQLRLSPLVTAIHQGQSVLSAPIPPSILRLQRREFFRLEPPLASPILCKLAIGEANGGLETFELTLSDISGGGVCLIGPTESAGQFARDTLFQQCRLDIPGEGVIQVNLRVRKTVEISDRNGQHSLRIGCEFVSLPGTRLAFIERYITRIERERKARDSGLAD
ncbi:flagellar brake protein [Dechloromonas sp. A34]|uniref:flagellar brake protein n=1 Tax=Dechloromonas sp. A34 TaxID=447588 RepID=UPI0022499A91|nr:flagellar brake protein [Dechloromonas sp. A34]